MKKTVKCMSWPDHGRLFLHSYGHVKKDCHHHNPSTEGSKLFLILQTSTSQKTKEQHFAVENCFLNENLVAKHLVLSMLWIWKIRTACGASWYAYGKECSKNQRQTSLGLILQLVPAPESEGRRRKRIILKTQVSPFLQYNTYRINF